MYKKTQSTPSPISKTRKGKEFPKYDTEEMLKKPGDQMVSREKTMQSIAAVEFMSCFSRRGRLPAQRMTEKY